jgi:uncharacterized protein (DUF1501 family)
LLAKKLTESGAVCVEVDLGGWDNHQNIFQALHTTQGTGRIDTLDRAMAALVEDLVKEGRWQDTVVVWMGEFGRTPRINDNISRDHWPECYTVLLAGGGLKRGFVYGASDKNGAFPERDPVRPDDLAATMFAALGIDPGSEVLDPADRPLPIAAGQPITELFA